MSEVECFIATTTFGNTRVLKAEGTWERSPRPAAFHLDDRRPHPLLSSHAAIGYRTSSVIGSDTSEARQIMVTRSWIAHVSFRSVVVLTALILGAETARADGNLQHLRHIIIAMQENHSFDNYLGVLAYLPNTPYHSGKLKGPHHECAAMDHTCVDGLTCVLSRRRGALICLNSSLSNTRGRVRSFHEPRYCTGPDLDHSWTGSHEEANLRRPNTTLRSSPDNGFVRVNAKTEAPEQATDHDTMGYYTDADLPFYYGLAETFAISDRYFAAVLGPTFPNRSYLLAGTSFGHLTTSEIIGPYQPITGTIFDELDAHGISWTDYAADIPYSSLLFRVSAGHTKPVSMFVADAAAGALPAVAFVDPSFVADQTINGAKYETDEHPPNDIRAGEYFVAQLITALRNSPSWNDSVLFLTYDEHGGFYDHVKPPAAAQGNARTPDGIAPGQCADASSPPASKQPGGGANCSDSKTMDAPTLCSGFTPTGPYPADCATFNQLGFRLPFIVVSPFAKPHYVSHTVGSHTSLLAFIEKRFSLPSLTARDANANDLEEMFDFDNSPSLNASLATAPLPVQPGDPNCPFTGSPSGAFVDDRVEHVRPDVERATTSRPRASTRPYPHTDPDPAPGLPRA
jgi:phospholipase C